MLEKNTSLTSIDLSGNDLGYPVIPSLTSCLRANTTIRHMDVGHNNFDVDCVEDLCKGLQVGHEPADRQVNSCLQKNATIQSFGMSGNPLKVHGVKPFIAIVAVSSLRCS